MSTLRRELLEQPTMLPGQSLYDNIASQVDVIRDSAGAVGEITCPPIMALGISERVGSNWFLDTLASSLHTHNEPFRQQLHASHPMSTISPRPVSAKDYALEEMHPYERYWLTSFVASKYGPRPQIVKETNLFFATQNLLELFPDSKAIVLARNPAGIASSFANGNLFERWNYPERYNQLKAMTREPQFDRFGFVFEGEHDPGSLRKLTRLIVLNTLLVSAALEGRQKLVVKYEDSVMDRQATLQRLSEFLMSEGVSIGSLNEELQATEQSEHDFSTRKRKLNLEVDLDKDDLHVIGAEVRRLLADSLSVLSETQYLEVQGLLENHSRGYEARGRKPKQDRVIAQKIVEDRPSIEYVDDHEGRQWLNQPVSNSDFVKFLNAMYQEGLPNVIHGVQLFVNENMIRERGGRIHFNANSGEYEVTPDYESHPVYWATWLGAAAYARYAGCRLPDKYEIQSLTKSLISEIDFGQINAGHKQGDANRIGQSLANSIGIYDAVGSVASWCRDGVSDAPGKGLSRHMYGTAWNRDSSIDELEKDKLRPISGCSRSVGVRLIRDELQALQPSEIAVRFEGWFNLLGRDLDPSRADRYIVDQLTR